jgi:hypothetical protein
MERPEGAPGDCDIIERPAEAGASFDGKNYGFTSCTLYYWHSSQHQMATSVLVPVIGARLADWALSIAVRNEGLKWKSITLINAQSGGLIFVCIT